MPVHVGAIALKVIIAAVAIGPASASDSAFQGHAAEMQMRSEDAERRRRALFFDDVDIEIGAPGLPCDHIVKSKPHAVSGRGHVALLREAATPPRRVRVWLRPDTASSDNPSDQVRSLAIARTGAADLVVEDLHAFWWCR